jgi:hypothetical protein
MAILTLNKLDAAARQLNTAITMWFKREDPVSTHTLACAAYQVIHDVNSSRGGPELLYDALCFKDEFRGQIIREFRKEYDFFRHADRSPDGVIDFDEDLAEKFLLVGSYGLEALGYTPDLIRGAFNIYFSIRNPEYLTEVGRARFKDGLQADAVEKALSISREQFFEAYKLLRTQQ